MILEVAILDVILTQTRQFERAFCEAQKIISSMDGYLTHTLKRCIESSNRYILLVEWTTLAAHTDGFRQSPDYQQWQALLHHYYSPFPTVEHYETVVFEQPLSLSGLSETTEYLKAQRPLGAEQHSLKSQRQ